MRGIVAFVGGVLLIAAIFAGWWAIDRVQEHLPGPVNAVLDSVQSGGLPGAGPLVQPLPTGRDESEPAGALDACADFRDDAERIGLTIQASSSLAPGEAEANNAVVGRELERIADGGAARPLTASGVAAALDAQASGLEAAAAALDDVQLQTPAARSLAAGFAAAARRAAEANRRFIVQAPGTRAQWEQWYDAVAGPAAQAAAAARGLNRCPA